MSVTEMKKKINEKIDTLNEEQLKEVDIFITKINNLFTDDWNLLSHVENIVSERAEVLRKLAQ